MPIRTVVVFALPLLAVDLGLALIRADAVLETKTAPGPTVVDHSADSSFIVPFVDVSTA